MSNPHKTHIMVYKPAGITMNQLILDYKQKNNISKICFAGRLDPMARGNCIFLFNEECKKIDNYKNLDKTYEFRIIVGLQTISDDPLGIIQNIRQDLMTEEYTINMKQKLESIDCIFNKSRKFEQKYHILSTKCFNLKDNKTSTITIPSHSVSIYSCEIREPEKYDFQEWVNNIISQINTIDKKCDFNQTNIINQWKEQLEHKKEYGTEIKELYAIPVRLKVSSGFYVRQFVRDISNHFNIPLMTYDINRISFNK
jgi:tRNA U55 pseudouridine synthase TruB